MAEVTRVRVELQEQNGRLQAELTAQEALREKVAALERQLKGEAEPGLPPPRQSLSAVGYLMTAGWAAELSLDWVSAPRGAGWVGAASRGPSPRSAPLPSSRWGHASSLSFFPCSDHR